MTTLELLEKAASSSDKQSTYLILARHLGSLTPAQCIMEGTQVRVLKKENESRLHELLKEAVTMVNLTVNVSSKLNDFQVADAVIQIVNQYGDYRVEEIVKALNNGRTGMYNDKKNPLWRLDLPTLCFWIDTYLDREREAALNELRQLQYNGPAKQTEPISDEKVKYYGELFRKNMQAIIDKKNKENPKEVFDERGIVENWRNNLPLLTDEALKEWRSFAKKNKEEQMLEWIDQEIQWRDSRDKQPKEGAR